MLNRFLIVFFISSNIFSQTQVVIVEEMLMDVPFAGEIKYTTTKYASDNLFKRDMEIEVGSFLVRMAMGGNKKLGEFIDGDKKMRTVYDLNEEEYAQETFQTIIENDGKPTLEIPLVVQWVVEVEAILIMKRTIKMKKMKTKLMKMKRTTRSDEL